MQDEHEDMAVNGPTVVYEDDDVLVINKPVGWMVHEDGFADEKTVVDWFLEKYPDAKGVGEPGFSPQGKELKRSGVVHRLDKDTSGILILAKNQEAFEFLKQQFKNREVKKEYRALVYGRMHEKWGTVDRPIGRSAKDFRRRSAERGAKGTLRDSVTDWECIGTGEYETEPFSYLNLKPKTGRTHQLRVHMKAIDRPIVGDKLYAGKKLESSNNLDLGRMALHAHRLELVLPNGSTERFIAPIPEALERAVERIAEA